MDPHEDVAHITVKEGEYVIKRVDPKEDYKSPGIKDSSKFRRDLLAKQLSTVQMRLVRSSTAKNRLEQSRAGGPLLYRTDTKYDCGPECVLDSMTWISMRDIQDYVDTMQLVSIGHVNSELKLFDMTKSIPDRLFTDECIRCIYRILSDKNDDQLIGYKGGEILELYIQAMLEVGIINEHTPKSEIIGKLICMAFGGDKLTLSQQIDVLRAYQGMMIRYLNDVKVFPMTRQEIIDKLNTINGDDLWDKNEWGWWMFTGKFGFSVADGKITPYKLIEEWIKTVNHLRMDGNSQRCSIYSLDLLISLILCIVSTSNGLNFSGYFYKPRNDEMRLKDEQLEYCLTASGIDRNISWCPAFIHSELIEDLGEKYRKTMRAVEAKRKAFAAEQAAGTPMGQLLAQKQDGQGGGIYKKGRKKRKTIKRKTKKIKKRTQKRTKRTLKRMKRTKRNKRMRGGSMFGNKKRECGPELELMREQNEILEGLMAELNREHGQCIKERDELMGKSGFRKLTPGEQKVKQRFSGGPLFSDALEGEGRTYVKGGKLFTIIDGREVPVPKREEGFGSPYLAEAFENRREVRRAEADAVHRRRVEKLTALGQKNRRN